MSELSTLNAKIKAAIRKEDRHVERIERGNYDRRTISKASKPRRQQRAEVPAENRESDQRPPEPTK